MPAEVMNRAENSEHHEVKQQLMLYLQVHRSIDKCIVEPQRHSIDKATIEENNKREPEHERPREHYINCWNVQKLLELRAFMEIELDEKGKP
jgi:hypothetical protein